MKLLHRHACRHAWPVSRPIGKHLASLIAVSLAFAPLSSSAQQPTGTNSVYTTIKDFSYGTLMNTTTALTPFGTTGQVQFSPTSKPFPYLYVAVSARGTLVRIDINSGAILGEYVTAPDGNGRDPSRTTVDQLGNVWVSNRAEAGSSPLPSSPPKGSVTRIGLVVGGTRLANDPLKIGPPWTYNTCVDRDGDGFIKTSSGLADIRPWPGGGPGGANTHGGVTKAEDECIINYTRVAGTNARTVAIDNNNDLWVGGSNSKHEKLNGALPPDANSGNPIAGTEFQALCGGYGGFIDKFGVLWSARYFQNPLTSYNLLRFDPAVGGTGQCLNSTHGDYGLALDPKTCHVWQTRGVDSKLQNVDPYAPGFNPTLYTGEILEMDPSGTVQPGSPRAHGKPFAQGVAVDGSANIWVAHSIIAPGPGIPAISGIVPANTVGHLRTNGNFVGNVTLVDPINPATVGIGPTGVAVDSNGKVWVTNLYTNNVMRIDPDPLGGSVGADFVTKIGAVDLTVDLGSGASPYNYSDMTGDQAISNPTQGFWNVKHDGLVPGTAWGRIKWNTEPEKLIPAGSSITVSARAADTMAGLGPYIPVTNDVPFNLTGRFIEVRATLKATANAGCVETASPILSDLRFIARATCDIDRDGDGDQTDLALISRGRGQTPLPGDPRDANGDGRIDSADVKACIPVCTRANCATQ